MSRPAPVVSVTGPVADAHRVILTQEAIRFVADLVRAFRPDLDDLLARRRERQAELDHGASLQFLEETRELRQARWHVAPVPKDLERRIVEITGPVDRKMIINALNSGADVFMADFEDASSPTWRNMIEGQVNLFDAVRRTITFDDPGRGKRYALNETVATLLVRPRGLHLPERHFLVDGRPAPGALVDFGFYFFHNAIERLERGSGPYFYLPKLESHREARWWNEVFVFAERGLGIPVGTIKATVLIETLHAAFQMDEILYELKDHSAGLNCGRWDYIFSFIKARRNDPSAILPDRGEVTMEQPFMRAYTRLLIQTCHRRRAHAMGGMAAQIPIRHDPEAGAAALAKVRADKLREVSDGHDGTWVAHPGLVPVARAVFLAHMAGDHQLHRLREDVQVTAGDLLAVPTGKRTEAGLRHNVRVGVLYLEAWLRGTGCVPLYDLMEDAATAEICRAQIWQWIHHAARLDDGRVVDRALFQALLEDEMLALTDEVGPARVESGRFGEALRLFAELCLADDLADFLTLNAYELLVSSTDNWEPNTERVR